MFEYPKIHEIRSASDVVHPASTPENPITAAYVLVIRDRSPEGYIDDEFLDWNYILWWRRNYALNREDYGVGSYESKFDLSTLFSTQCLARLQVGRNPGLVFGRTLQKWIASWNNKPAGKGPFKDSRASQRAWRVLGKPKDGQTLYLKPDSLPSSSLEAILQRFAPKRKLDQTIRVSCWPEPTSFYRYRQQSKELYDSLYVQLFAVIDESGRSVIVFDGRLRFGRINPEVAERMRRAHQRHQEALSSQETEGQFWK
jgi:hypothetical protein